MPLPLCSDPLNDAWFTQLVDQINAFEVSSASATPAELQNLINQQFDGLALLNSQIASQLTLIAPLSALLTAPTDLASCISWITSAITVFTNMYAPFAKLTAQEAALAAQITSVTSAITALASAKGWSITIPSTAPFCTL